MSLENYLENKFFSIFKIQVENIINEEDRIEKLEDRLEVIFPRYNSDDFVLRYEILKKDRKKENIVVYLLDLVLLNDYIIDDMKDYGFVSIIPSFFVCREKKILNHYFNFDISETMLVVTEYMNNNILDISTFKLTKSSFDNDEEVDIEDKYSIANSYLVNIEDDIEIIFTGNKIIFLFLFFHLLHKYMKILLLLHLLLLLLLYLKIFLLNIYYHISLL